MIALLGEMAVDNARKVLVYCFQLQNLFCFKTTIIAVTEYQKQYIDDLPVTERKKQLKVEEIDR